MNTIKSCKINPTIGMIPTSYKISMTYEEQLLYFCNKLDKELIPALNNLIEEFSNYDANFQELFNRTDILQTEYDEMIIDLNNTKQEIYNEVDNKNNALYNRVIGLMNDYTASFNLALRNLKTELEAEIEAIELGNVKAYNPTTGTIENVSKVILDVYDSLRNNALTCTEFDTLELTATAFDALDVSAYNFDVNGKTFVHN